jgi:hypothetical protein
MPAVTIEISRFADSYQPGLVECVLVDADGRTHTFVEKFRIVSGEDLLPDSVYPRAGAIPCEIVRHWSDQSQRNLVNITTARPRDVESSTGQQRFVVLSSQIVY